MTAPIGLLGGARRVTGAIGFLRRHRELWPVCALPFAINLCVFGLAIFTFSVYLDPLAAALGGSLDVAEPDAWYAWLWIGPLRVLAWALRWLLILTFAVVVYFAFTVVGSVLASPFLDLLSARVERTRTGTLASSGAGGWRAALRVVREEAKRVGFFVALQLGWLAVGLVPGLQPFALVGLFVSSALFLPLEYTGFLLDRRGVSFRVRRAWLWRHRAAMFGFGVTALATFLVPGLNFLCLPLLVTAGTQLALDVGPPD